MATTIATPPIERRSLKGGPVHHYFIPASYRAFKLLRVAFVLAPLVAGVDKFFNGLVRWDQYLSPLASRITGLSPQRFMSIVGVIEIVAAFIVAFKPRIGGIIVAIWLWGIIANLLSIPGYYDIALRDFGLSLGALALSRLSVEFADYRRQGWRSPR